ncbi:unnamed protein product [Effrenium voratum]|nr:unnamed protein product [Effrenium voratum]
MLRASALVLAGRPFSAAKNRGESLTDRRSREAGGGYPSFAKERFGGSEGATGAGNAGNAMADDRGSRDWLPPLLETDEFEPEELEDSEMVELPKRALPVKPGIQHMRSLKHSGSSDLTEEICNMLKIQHAEVMQRFDQLGLVLKEVSENVQGKSLPVNRMPSVKAKAQKQVRLNLPQGATEIKRKPTFTPKLFSSLTQADMLLKQGAADVDADQAKAKKESLASQTMSVANGSCLHAFVFSNHFDVFFAVAILTNMVFIGFEVQYNLENPGPESVMIQVVRNVYTGLFSMELLLRICASGCRSFLCGRDMNGTSWTSSSCSAAGGRLSSRSPTPSTWTAWNPWSASQGCGPCGSCASRGW